MSELPRNLTMGCLSDWDLVDRATCCEHVREIGPFPKGGLVPGKTSGSFTITSVSFVPSPRCDGCGAKMTNVRDDVWRCAACEVEEHMGVFPLKRGSS